MSLFKQQRMVEREGRESHRGTPPVVGLENRGRGMNQGM